MVHHLNKYYLLFLPLSLPEALKWLRELRTKHMSKCIMLPSKRSAASGLIFPNSVWLKIGNSIVTVKRLNPLKETSKEQLYWNQKSILSVLVIDIQQSALVSSNPDQYFYRFRHFVFCTITNGQVIIPRQNLQK